MTAVKAAGLVDTLKGTGPFTVFAPTDEAFAKVPKEVLDNLLAYKRKLTAVLTYHAAPGLVLARDVWAGKPKKPLKLQNSRSRRMAVSRLMMQTKSRPDIITSNGVIHVIDAVVVPK